MDGRDTHRVGGRRDLERRIAVAVRDKRMQTAAPRFRRGYHRLHRRRAAVASARFVNVTEKVGL